MLDHTVNFHHEHSIVPTNCPWVSEDGSYSKNVDYLSIDLMTTKYFLDALFSGHNFRLDFRSSLGPSRLIREWSAGSFPEQRQVIEPTTTLAIISHLSFLRATLRNYTF